MSEPGDPSVLRRKLSAPANRVERTEMSLEKAFNLAVIRTAEKMAQLEMQVTGFVEERVSLGEIVTLVENPYLIQRTRNAEKTEGLALWCAKSVSALTEHLITGRLSSTAPEPRPPTATDAAVVQDLLNGILTVFDQGLAQIKNVPLVKGYRAAGLFEDGRAISMVFDEIAYRSFNITLSISNGLRVGELRLIYPWSPGGAPRVPDREKTSWKANWQDAVKNSRIPIEAVLHRLTIPLDEISRIEIGTEIHIPTSAIDTVLLEGTDRKGVALGRLGQSNGYRAVRVALMAPENGKNQYQFSAQGVIDGQGEQPALGVDATTAEPSEPPIQEGVEQQVIPTKTPEEQPG